MTDEDRDDVDGIVAAWHRERPDLDVSPLHVFSRVTRMSIRLGRVRAAAFATHGLALWEFDVLAALRRAGAPYALSPTELARLTHVTSGTMTNRITRLAARDLVTRDADPRDGRAAIVRLSASGRATVDAALVALLEREGALLAGLDESERRVLADLLSGLMVRLEHDTYGADPS